jgi:putative SOS response-associated peptidase YedK
MCGRFTLTVNEQQLIDSFQLEFFPDEYEPSFNIAPSQPVLAAVDSESGRRAGFLKWGLIPNWVKDPKAWKPLINAKSETLTEKASFKQLLNKKRCIIFADSFYEWKKENGKKIPHRIMTKDERPIAFAGLWDRNRVGDKEMVTCTILTTSANEAVKDVHDRMPVILNGEEAVEMWLNTNQFSFNEAKEVMQPYPVEEQKLYIVSELVNSPKNNVPDCIRPITY